MKTHVEAKTRASSRRPAMPVGNVLRHHAQLRHALRRTGVQPHLGIRTQCTVDAQAEHSTPNPEAEAAFEAGPGPAAQQLWLKRESNARMPSGVPIFKVDFSGHMQLLNFEDTPEALVNTHTWVRLSAPPTRAEAEAQAAETGESEAQEGFLAGLGENKTVQFLIGLPMGALAGAAPGGFLVGLVGEPTLFQKLPAHWRMGYGLGETLIGICQTIMGVKGLAAGGTLTAAGVVTAPTGVGLLAGAGGVGISVASAGTAIQGAANIGVGTGVFMEALDELSRNSPTPSPESPQTKAPKGQTRPGNATAPEYKLTEPGRQPNPHAKPDGRPQKIDYNKSNKTNIVGLEGENEAAQIFAKNGYHIEQQPKVLPRDGINPKKRPDYRIEGEIFDCSTPAYPNKRVQLIREDIRVKVSQGQTQRVVINLQKSKWEGSVEELATQFKDRKINGLKEVLIIDVNGSILRIFP